jgi:hypothetical protein
MSTLHRHIQKSSNKKQRGKFRRTFAQVEIEMAEHAKDMDDRFYGLTRESLAEPTLKLAEK